MTVVDAMHIEQHLDAEVTEGACCESAEQLAYADIVILNKCDLIMVRRGRKRVSMHDAATSAHSCSPLTGCQLLLIRVDPTLLCPAYDFFGDKVIIILARRPSLEIAR